MRLDGARNSVDDLNFRNFTFENEYRLNQKEQKKKRIKLLVQKYTRRAKKAF